jgi:uncharacterized damage-inducible protein DinB
MNADVAMLLQMLDEAFDRKTWHGTNLRGSIRGLTETEARWRPGRGRHNIWEIAFHAAYWKYAVRRRLLGGKRGSFPVKGSNWFVRPASGTTWKEDIALLDSVHRQLRDAVANLPPDALDAIPQGSKVSTRSVLIGIAYHDVYHAGQIQLLKRLYKGRQR